MMNFAILTSAARTATGQTGDFTVPGRGMTLFLDISAASGTTPTLDVKVQAKDPVSGEYVDWPSAAFAQKTATGTDTLTIYPGITASANRAVSSILPNIWRVVYTIGGTTPSFTFTLAASAHL